MSGRVYSVAGENLTLTTAVRMLLAFTTAASPNAASLVEILRLSITQSGTVTGAMIRAALSLRTGGTVTATSVTPANLKVGGAASGLVGNTAPVGAAGRIGINATVDTTPTYTNLLTRSFHNLNGMEWIPTPDERIIVPPSTAIALRLLADPATLTGWNFECVYKEII